MVYKTTKHLIETDPEYAFLYANLLKNENYWRNNGQYFIAKEYETRAKLLLNNDYDNASKVVQTEGRYCPTKKINFD
tara:strand:- start:201 stop:431 length:231 start_codon:yes stop_codon:yes gene_type:complete